MQTILFRYLLKMMKQQVQTSMNLAFITILLVSAVVIAENSTEKPKAQDCKWSSWVDHGCSATCGEHVKRTKKRIKLQEASQGGRNCRGATTRIMPCKLPECENVKIPDDFAYPDYLGDLLINN